MPENQEQENQTTHSNSFQYHPNRPQNSSQNNSEADEHADTKKVVDTAAKGAAEYFAPGVGAQAYDALKKAPGVGEQIDQAVGQAAQTVDQIPGAKKLSKGLNESGATDAANQAIDLIGSKGASGVSSGVKGTPAKGSSPSGSNLGQTGSRQATYGGEASPLTSMHKNAQFQSMMQNDDATEEGSSASNDHFDSGEKLEEQNSLEPVDDSLNSQEGIENENPDDSSNSDESKNSGDIIQSFLKKNRFPILIGAGIICFFLILILVLIGGGGVNELNNTLGYMDSLCNYNETKVTLLDCYQNSSEANELATYDLQDFVINMAYAYTRDGNYSDETIKALMIVLKTNTLSYGHYNSSDKHVDVRVCDLFSEYNSGDSDQELWMFEGVNILDFTNLYNEISNYLYLSSSYRSVISNLSRQNILDFDASVLDEFESLASEGNTYSQILNTYYGSGDGEEDQDTNTIYRETLFLGDSRMQGILNAGVINSGNTIYGVGLGYEWLVGNGDFNNTNASSGGISGINDLMRDQANYNIVIWLGVNDLGNVESYYQEYYHLATGEWSNHNIYVVSVGPVDSTLSLSATNEAIETFNRTMQNLISGSGLSNLFYIDLGYTEDSILEYDDEGIHYSDDDYRGIYEIIMGHLDNSLNSSYQLYNLTSYCTYYTLTDNDAYWWPVGSQDATQGNIYGGEPVSIRITSYFGPRIDPITHVVYSGHGAIDIGVGTGTPVIATKSGEITKINTGCSVGDYSCGGSYGNYIKIDHGDGIESLYAHLSEVLVDIGDQVVAGQIIGYSGNTGRSTGPHLHFEIRLNGTKVDPLDYVDPENPRPVNTIPIAEGDVSDNKYRVCSSLLSSGFSVNATVGIMANIYPESSYSPINLQNSYESSLGFTDSSYTLAVDQGTYTNFIEDAAGYGLAQWTYSGRKRRLYNYVQERNASIGDFDAQYNFMLYELETYYPDIYKYVTGNHSAQEIGVMWCDWYEGPGGSEECRDRGVCPSNYCSVRTSNAIESQNLVSYVQNGCSE